MSNSSVLTQHDTLDTAWLQKITATLEHVKDLKFSVEGASFASCTCIYQKITY